jgi:hypothetical protein
MHVSDHSIGTYFTNNYYPIALHSTGGNYFNIDMHKRFRQVRAVEGRGPRASLTRTRLIRSGVFRARCGEGHVGLAHDYLLYVLHTGCFCMSTSLLWTTCLYIVRCLFRSAVL